MTRFVWSGFLAFFLFASTSFAVSFEEAPIGEFHQVTDGVLRGARPSSEGLRYLAQIGVKTILNLENDSKQVAWETAEAAKLGIKVISTPMSGFWRPKTAQVNKSLSFVNDSSLYPLFVHCQHGRDRTGLITGLYRVFYQKWDPAVAYEEMLDNGFRPILFLLDQYYSDKTGYHHPSPQDSVYWPN